MSGEKKKGRTSVVDLKKAVHLLKFEQHEKGELVEAGINKLKCLPPSAKICPVVFIGDGRGGKSYMASRLAGDEDSFVSSDSAEPVTEGIDMVLCPMAPRLKECGLKDDDAEDEYLLILDCEGGNNAMAAIRTLVNVFGIVVGTQVVFIASGMASEQALNNLAASLAASSLIKLDSSSKLPSRRLHFLVNKNTLKYKEDDLEKMLTMEGAKMKEGDSGRMECRNAIMDSFEFREFHCIGMMGMPNFEEQVVKFQSSVLKQRKPFVVSGTPVNGQSLVGLLDLIVTEIRKTNEVSFPSMHRFVILDGFLLPLAEKLTEAYKAILPEIDDWDADLDTKNTKKEVLKDFMGQVEYIGHKSLITEAEGILEKKLDDLWDVVSRKNNAFGDQVLGEVQTETREVASDTNKGPIGGRGLLRKIEVTMQKMKVESRAVINRKRGGAPELGPWMDTGSTTTRILESAFEMYGTMPTIRGKLAKKRPHILSMVMKKQERACMLKDGHFLWWDPDKLKTQAQGEASGCINLLINRAEVVKDPSDYSCFIIKPRSASGWNDSSCFSGGEQRDFTFDASGCEVDVNEWIAGIQAHIKFADLVFEQLGEEKITEQVGIYKPTLAQVDA